jgi:hypothetical protein
MIVLDTNVVSELLRPVPEPRVKAWLAAQNGPDVHLTAVSEAELRRGVCMLPAGRLQAVLADAIEAILKQDFAGRVLPFDSAAAKAFATIFLDRRNAGRPISLPDCQIAAIVRFQHAAIATRNVGDFEGCGIEVIDPWSD